MEVEGTIEWEGGGDSKTGTDRPPVARRQGSEAARYGGRGSCLGVAALESAQLRPRLPAGGKPAEEDASRGALAQHFDAPLLLLLLLEGEKLLRGARELEQLPL